MTIEKRATAGSMAGVAGVALNLIQSLLLVPLLLSVWSAETYGLWMAVGAVVALLISFDTGHQNYLGNVFNRQWVEDKVALAETVRSGIRAAAVIAIIELLVGLAIIVSRRLDLVPGLSEKSAVGVAGAVTLNLVFWVLNGSIGGVLVRLYAPAGLYAWAQWQGNIYRLAGFLAVVVAVSAGASIFVAMLAQVLTWSTFNIFTFWELRRRFPEVHPWWRGGRWSLAWTNFRASLLLTIIGVVEQAASIGLVLFVGHTLNPLSVALFTTVRTVANIGLQGSTIMISPMAPDMVRYHVSGEGGKLVAVFSTSWLLGTSLVTAGLTVGVLVVEPLYTLWTRGALALDRQLLAFLCIAVAVRQWAAPFQTYLAGMNRLRTQSVMAGVRAALGLGLAALLLPQWGLPAAGLGALAAELGAAIVAVVAVCPQLRAFGATFPAKASICSLVQIVAAGAVWISYSTGVPGWPVGTVFSLGLIGVLAWRQWQVLPGEVRVRLLGLLRRPIST